MFRRVGRVVAQTRTALWRATWMRHATGAVSRAAGEVSAGSASDGLAASVDEGGAVALGEVRNFAILAHIDHGKSTLADRIIDACGGEEGRRRGGREQALDTLEVEQERGITVKANSATLRYGGKVLNLIDTPGHADFGLEVARSLAAVDGVLLLVDAAQGVQAQTLAVARLAAAARLAIVPVLNKIDLPAADIDGTLEALEATLGIDPESPDICLVSAKTGEGVPELLDVLVRAIPPPSPLPLPPHLADLPLAVAFDSRYDTFRGIVASVAVMAGELSAGTALAPLALGSAAGRKPFKLTLGEVGTLHPHEQPCPVLGAGRAGFAATGVKDAGVQVAGTLLAPPEHRLALGIGGEPMVFAGLYPGEPDEYEDLASALARLALNDPAVSVAKTATAALGSGFRLGFLGLLHADVFRQRLESEHGADVILTAPSVPYRVVLAGGEEVLVETGAAWPASEGKIVGTYEPRVTGTILVPADRLSGVMDLVLRRRGEVTETATVGGDALEVAVALPLASVVTDFVDELKSRTGGYASFQYQAAGYAKAPLGLVTVMLNGEPVEALSFVAHRDEARAMGVKYVSKLKEAMSRTLFEIKIQASFNGRIVARETIKAFRKDTIGHLYGGDRTRKDKLLKKQKRGKARMRAMGKVNLPKDTYKAILSTKL
ncbi:GTP-binding protein LepA [Thecamonas trahens ATCC 50062]|uniref:Translation factor GUF1 homolog, mitochondrial n=1 Tax=Thecamonas trahens ATCC 50062 TaxID=461836 RepID=A0A0L0DS51_THETB|nr:GTP-binding protein LepA [Thecamonas trahens ATCC 50062]KNC55090.1 GTP-binding protein LepA [Thecamonas trahens ATCC 50062]|eukprot:XP_013753274.1 GTP-binding protein LepA [Thecamonas trahens ATCC 50062]